MFADVVGSTALVDGMDPERSIAALEPFVQMMFSAVRTYGGTVNKIQGDGVMALFGAPMAHEDHAARACLAALMLIGDVKQRFGTTAPVRVGLHSGLVVVRSINNDMSSAYEAGGPAVHLAARMEQLAEPGSVRVTEATYLLASKAIEFRSLGAVVPKGFSESVTTFAAIAARHSQASETDAPARLRSSFIGRATEIGALHEALDRCAEGMGECIQIVGPAGIGKSRIARQCTASAAPSHWRILRAACEPYHQNTSYYGVRQLLQSWLAGEAGTSEDTADRFSSALAALGSGLVAELSPLRALLALPVDDHDWNALEPILRLRRITDAFCRIMLAVLQRHPQLVVIEDLHWADAGTVQLLRELARRIATCPCLLLVTARDAVDLPGRTLALDALTATEATLLLDELLGSARALTPLKQKILEATDGIPLFIEETVNALFDTGDLVRSGQAVTLTRRLNALKLPATLTAILASRLDQLGRSLKWTLQVAAVVGSDFPCALLAQILSRPDADLETDLTTLLRLGFLRRRNSGAENIYSFKHALMRDVAYNSLLQDQRISLHATVCETIEASLANRLDEQMERLAQHSAMGELWQKAVPYASQAAERAYQNSALNDACQFYDLALTCAGKLQPDRDVLLQTADLHLRLRLALWPLGNVEEANAHLDCAERIAEHVGDHNRLALISISRAGILSAEGNLDAAVAAGLRAQARAARVDDLMVTIRAGFALAQAHQFRGDFRRSIAMLEPFQEQLLGPLRFERLLFNANTTSVQHLTVLSRSHCMLGDFARAERLAVEALQIGRTTKRGFDVGFALQALGTLALLRGEASSAIAPLEEAIRICETDSLNVLFPLVASPLAIARMATCAHHSARQMLDEGMAAAAEARLTFYRTWSVGLLARVTIQYGLPGDAIDQVRSSLTLASTSGYRWIETWLRHAVGVALAEAAPEKGLELIEQAARSAAGLEMLPDLALCELSCAAVLTRLGRLDAARERECAGRLLLRQCGLANPPGLPREPLDRATRVPALSG